MAAGIGCVRWASLMIVVGEVGCGVGRLLSELLDYCGNWECLLSCVCFECFACFSLDCELTSFSSLLVIV